MKSILKKFLYYFALIIPTKKKIIFESNPILSDNTFPVFEKIYNNQKFQFHTFFWVSFSENDTSKILKRNYKNISIIEMFPKTKINRISNFLRGYYHVASSQAYFYSHRNIGVGKPKINQKIVNITHGVPLKNSAGLHDSTALQTDIISLSDFSSTLRLSTYDGGEKLIKELGFPRNDILICNKDHEKNLQNIFGDFIVWLPTYRTHRSKLDPDKSDFFPLDLEIKDWESINKLLVKNNYKLMIKPHPAQQIKIDLEGLEAIMVIDDTWIFNRGIQLYDLLSFSRALITDYSSVYVDYLLTDKPIIFTFDDIDSYLSEWGFTVPDIYEYTPGIHVHDKIEFVKELELSLVEEKDPKQKERKRLTKVFHKYQDGNSTDRVISILELF